MNKILKKILIIFFIFIFLTEFSINSGIGIKSSMMSYAESDDVVGDAINDTIDVVVGLTSGIIGIITWKDRLMYLIVPLCIQILGAAVATTGAKVGSGELLNTFTPDNIFFNNYSITSIDFFGGAGDDNDILASIRDNIAMWYYVMVMIAIVILLGMLIYVGIRMVISTVASDKAKYKKMLIDWLTSLALVFVLHFIIIATIKVNNSFVEVLGKVGRNNSTHLNETTANLLLLTLSPSMITGYGALIVFVFLQLETFVFLLMYIKRMFTVAFLIIISPLITITYSLDKMGDQKAQALNNWLKEFFVNVLIQPFHCILYLVFVDIALGALTGGGNGWAAFIGIGSSIGGAVFAIIALKFILDGEKIVKKIFGLEAGSIGNALASAGMVASAIGKGTQKLGSAADTGKKFVNSTGGFKGLPGKLGSKSENIINRKNDFLNERKNKKVNKIMEKDGISKEAAEKKYDEKQKRRDDFVSSRAEKVSGKVEDVLASQTFAKAAARTGGALTALSTYLASEDESGLVMGAITGKNVHDNILGKVQNWQKRKTSSFEDEAVGNFRAYARMTNKSSDLTTEEGMNNFKQYMTETYNNGKYGDAYSSKANQEAGKDLEKAFTGKGISTTDINSLKAQLAYELSDENAGQFDPKRLYDQSGAFNSKMSYDDFEKTISPYVIQQLASNMYNNTEQFDACMFGRGIDHEAAIKNVEANREKFTPVTPPINNTETESIIQTIGEDEIKRAITEAKANGDTSIDTVIGRLETTIDSKLLDLKTKIGSEDIISNIEKQVNQEIQNAAREGRQVNISSIGKEEIEKKYVTTFVQQKYITEKRNTIETYIREQKKDD